MSAIGPEEVGCNGSKDPWIVLDEMGCNEREWRGKVVDAEAQ